MPEEMKGQSIPSSNADTICLLYGMRIARMSASSVQRCPSSRWSHQAPVAVPARMHRTSPSLPASSIPGPGPFGLQVWPYTNLSGWMCGNSLYLHHSL